jgi:hypothetical protein
MGQHPKYEEMRLNREQKSWCENISSFVLADTTKSMATKIHRKRLQSQ